MLLRDHDSLCQPILDYLRGGERPAWEIEEELARLFNVTEAERAQLQPNSKVPVFTNDVAVALKKLVETQRITKSGMRRSPRGGRRGDYRLGAFAT